MSGGLAAMTRGQPWRVLSLALLLRLGAIALLDPHAWMAGGDGPWYVRQGWLIARDALSSPPRTIGPLYPLMLAGVWLGFPGSPDPVGLLEIPASFLTAVRVVQAGLGTLTVWLVWLLARRLGLGRAGTAAATTGVAIGPAFLIESFMLRTETLFIALLTATVLVYVAASGRSGPARLVPAGVLCALAALTRPVLLAFPLVLAAQVYLVAGVRRGTQAAVVLLLAAAAVLAPWNLWLYRGTGYWMPEGFAANFMLGARAERWPLDRDGFHELEEGLRDADRTYAEEAARLIAADPAGWLGRRAAGVVSAILQPHGTSDLGGPSVKAQLARWLDEDRSAFGLWRIVSRPGFMARFVIYVFHYVALVLAAIGVWATWPHRRVWWPIYGLVLYFLVVHGLLTVSPRYVFPIEAFLWVLAGAGADACVTRRPRVSTDEK